MFHLDQREIMPRDFKPGFGGVFASLLAALLVVLTTTAKAADQVKVGVFPVSSALPFFVAVERGYFAEQGIEPVPTRLASGTLIIQSFLSGDLETASALVTTEAFNVNLMTKNTILYLSINGQNEQNRQETFVVRKGLDASTIKDLKGKATKIMSASGPANVAFAKAVLKANGLEEGKDYTMTDLALNLHVSAMTAGTFDAGFTLEPAGTMLKANGGAAELEGGVIATYILGRKDAMVFAAGGAITTKFAKERPDVARRYAIAWRKAIETIDRDPSTRDALKVNTSVPPELVMKVGLPKFVMADQVTTQNMADFQKYMDFATAQGIVKGQVDVTKYLVTLDK
jgi:NitT/TauT family transport system substrate-binding protein